MTATQTVGDYDPFDPAVMADPMPYYRRLRDHDPVHYLQKWDAYALSRFADIWNVLEIIQHTVGGSGGRPPPLCWKIGTQ